MAHDNNNPAIKKKRIGLGGALLRGLVGAVLVLVGGTAFLTRTDIGRSSLVSMIEWGASSQGFKLSIGRLEGAVPFNMSVSDVRIADSVGDWLKIDDAYLSWNPLALFSGVLDIQSIKVGHIELVRTPDVDDELQSDDTSEGFLQLPIGVRLEELKVAEVRLGEGVLGEAAGFSINGSAEITNKDQGLKLDFSINRIDGQSGQIIGRLDYAPKEEVLAVDIEAEEPAGGLLSRLAGLKDLPPVSVIVKGHGPLDNWRGQLVLDAAEKASMSGAVSIVRSDMARILTAEMNADIAALMPSDLAPLVSGKSDAVVEAHFNDDGRIEVTKAQLTAAAAELVAHGFFTPTSEKVSVSARITAGKPQSFARLLPSLVSWSGAGIDINVGGTLSALDITANAVVSDVLAEGYQAKGAHLILRAKSNGRVADKFAPFGLSLEGKIHQLAEAYVSPIKVLGKTIEINAHGSLDQTLIANIHEANIVLDPMRLQFSGTVSPQEAVGKIGLHEADLSVLQPILGPEIAGKGNINADLDVAFDLSRLSLKIDGNMHGLRTGISQIDGLAGDTLLLSGGAKRALDGSFEIDDFKIDATHFQLTANGSATQSAADIKADLQISDLNKLDNQLEGQGVVSLALTGGLEKLNVKTVVSIPKAQAMGRPIEGVTLVADVQDVLKTAAGTLDLHGSVNGKETKGAGRFSRSLDGSLLLNDFNLETGSVALKGGVAVDDHRLASGKIIIKADNLADLEPFLLTQLGGRIDLQADFSHPNGSQNARVSGNADQLSGFGASLKHARINAEGRDLFRHPVLNGAIELESLSTNDINISNAKLTASGQEKTSDVRLTGVVQGADINAAAFITTGDTTNVVINQARVSRGNRRIELQKGGRVVVRDGTVLINDFDIRSGGGRIQLAGKTGETIEISTAINNFPLAALELFSPDLGLGGILSGEATITGHPFRPDGRYKFNVAGLTLPATSDVGLLPISLTATGSLGQGRIMTETIIRGQNNLTLRIQGSAPLSEGSIDLTMAGPVDLGFANAVLSASGQTLTGTANIDLKIQGTTAAPLLGGSIRVANGHFQDPLQGLFFDNIHAVITGNERELTVTSLSARTRNGGMVTGSGKVAVDPAAGFPGNITIKAQRAQLVTSEMVNMVSNLDLAVSGPLAHSPMLSGSISVDNLQITIPDRFPLSLTPIPVQHIHPPPRVQARLQHEAEEAAQAVASKPFVMALDVTVSAPSRVFVRGQGINAELGGTLKVHGDLNHPIVDGGFQMRRGTLAIAGRTLTFSRGEVSFDGGSLDPTLDFMAQAPASDVTARIAVTGYASDPEIAISSSPELPRDEVFARLLFGRPVTNLSTSQTIRLAQAIAQLTGLGGGDALGNLGRSLGVDAIDIGADDAGKIDVGISKRINDNIYLGVKQGASAESSRVTVDFKMTDHIKLQGEAGADGSSAVGVGMEWDY